LSSTRRHTQTSTKFGNTLQMTVSTPPTACSRKFSKRFGPLSPSRLFHVLRDYVIAYAPDEKPLAVIAVLHGRRSPRVIAAILKGRE
jgi:hypothetical protein